MVRETRGQVTGLTRHDIMWARGEGGGVLQIDEDDDGC